MSTLALEALLERFAHCLDDQSAQRIAELHMDDSVQRRVDELAEKANEGLLTADEHSEYEILISAADVISIVKLKAQRRLRR